MRRSLADLVGHVSARDPDDPRRIVVSPGPTHSRPLRLPASDCVVLDLEGNRVSGAGDLPPGIELDLALYRRRPDVGAAIWATSTEAIASGIVGRDVLPIPISFAEFAHAGTAYVHPSRLRVGRQEAETWAHDLGDRTFLQVCGVATVATGRNIGAALWAAHGFEELARTTRRVLRLAESPAIMSAEDVARVFGRMPTERRPSRDPHAYLPSLDGPAALPVSRTWTSREPVDDVRRRIAIACRILAANGRLVAFLEHVSARVPGTDDVFAMSPAIDFASMTPADVGLVSMAGECPPVDGPYPPAPFRWFHRDVFAARPDVEAIVHTHEEYGRLFVAADRRPVPVFRIGARELVDPLPVFEPASLVFSADERAAVVELLGAGRQVHERFHGTDEVAASLEEATVAAVQREVGLAMLARAMELGEPAVLAEPLLASLASEGPTAEQWWDYYEDLLAIA